MESTVLEMECETIELSTNLQYEQSSRITEREVWKAANSLWAKKVDPSSNKVRELLGNRGSFRTIQLYLDTWRRQQIEQPAFDDPLWQELSKMRKKVEQQAKSAANSQIHAIQQECEGKLLEMQELQLLAEQERDTLKHQLQDLKSLLEKLNIEHNEVKEKFYDQEKRLVAAVCSKQLIEMQLQELKESSEKQLKIQTQEHQKEIDILNKKIRNNQSQFEEKLNFLSAKHEEQKSLLEKNITELLLKNSDLNFSLKIANEKEAQYLVEISTKKDQYDKLLKEIDRAENENNNLTEKLHFKEKELAVIEEKLKQSILIIDNLSSQQQEEQKQAIYYSQRIGQLEERIATLTKSIKRENEISSETEF